MSAWLLYAMGDMILFALAAVLAKAAVKKNNSNLSAAVWGILVTILTYILLRITGAGSPLSAIGGRTWLFLLLSGLAMGGAWLCLFRSMRTGEIIKIVPVYLSHYVLAMAVRMVWFRTEYSHNKIAAMIILSIGTLLVALHASSNRRGGYVWLGFALLAALFSCASTVLAEYGASGVNDYLGDVIRTAAALLAAIIAAAAVGGKTLRSMNFLDGIMLCLSGAAAGASAICYYFARVLGPDAVVRHMDCLSVLVVLVFGLIFLRERMSARAVVGYVLIVVGVFLMLLEKQII